MHVATSALQRSPADYLLRFPRVAQAWGRAREYDVGCASVVHLLLSLFFFSSFFLFGMILIGSTDLVYLNYPMLLIAKRNFASGELGLWNPYLMCGTPAARYAVSPLYSVENWPLFLIPERYFFLACTFASFIKLWLLGVFAYLLFREEVTSRKWAMFASVVFALSGYVNWVTMIFDAQSLLLYLTIALYVIWTMNRRSAHWNYIALTCLLAATLLAANTLLGLYAVAMLSVWFVLRHVPLERRGRVRRNVAIALLALSTASLLYCIRLLPFLYDLRETNRSQTPFVPDFLDSTFLLARLIIPEIFGITFDTTGAIIEAVSPQHHGWHVHWAMPHYFGVVAVLLVVWAALRVRHQAGRIWLGYVAAVMALLLFLQPFDALMRLLNPAYHVNSMHIWLPLGLCMLAGHAGLALERSPVRDDPIVRRAVTGSILWTGCYAFCLWAIYFLARVYPDDLLRIRLVTLCVIACAVALALSKPHKSLKVMIWLTVIALAILLLVAVEYGFANVTLRSHVMVLSSVLILLIGTFTLLLRANAHAAAPARTAACLAGATALAIFVWVYPWISAIRQLPSPTGAGIVAALGVLRFVLVGFGFLWLLREKETGRLNAGWLFPILTTILLLEQMPLEKVHGHLALNPFFASKSPYQPPQAYRNESGARVTLDQADYRVNHPNRLVAGPVYSALWGDFEILDSEYAVSGVRSYGGYLNVVPNRYALLAAKLTGKGLVFGGIYTDASNDRFLDLVGARYDCRKGRGVVMERPGALSRFMQYSNWEVVPEMSRTMTRLADPAFDPKSALLLDRYPRIPLSAATDTRTARAVSYESVTSDDLRLKVNSEEDSIVLFDDTYHDGWKAEVNGAPVEILIADGAFMAIPLPAGNAEVRLFFRPWTFVYGRALSVGGAIAFVVIAGLLYRTRRRDSPQTTSTAA